MANHTVKPSSPQPDLPAAAPDKERAPGKVGIEYLTAFMDAVFIPAKTGGVAIQSEGDRWVDIQTAFDNFLPEWRKVECDRRAAQSAFNDMLRQMRDEGLAEVTRADGRVYVRMQ